MPDDAPDHGPDHADPVPAGRARVRPHHVIAALVGIVVLVALALSGTVPSLQGVTKSLAAQTSTSPPPTNSSPTPSSTAKGALTLVALGDSVPAAETCGCAGYVERAGTRLESLTDRPWVVHNDANGGWTSSDVEDALGSSPTRDHLATADLVIVEVGANDFDLDRVGDQACLPAAGPGCWSSTLAEMRDGLTRIITGIRRVDQRPDLRIALLGYWNVTLDGSVGRALGEDFVLGSDELTKLVNDTVRGVATATGALYVDAYSPLKGPTGTRDPTGDLLDDGDHPNATGHTLLSEAVVDTLASAGAITSWRSASARRQRP